MGGEGCCGMYTQVCYDTKLIFFQCVKSREIVIGFEHNPAQFACSNPTQPRNTYNEHGDINLISRHRSRPNPAVIISSKCHPEKEEAARPPSKPPAQDEEATTTTAATITVPRKAAHPLPAWDEATTTTLTPPCNIRTAPPPPPMPTWGD